MSDPVTALGGTQVSGYISIRDAGLQGMISLRGDLGAAPLKKACKDASGVSMPSPRQMAGGLEGGIGWMSPDEALVLVPYAEAPAAVARMENTLRKSHALAVDVSDARAVFTLEGDKLREVLAKLTPADVAALPVGELRRTRLAQVAAALWLSDERTAHLICFRSVAEYVLGLLEMSSRPGSEVRAG